MKAMGANLKSRAVDSSLDSGFVLLSVSLFIMLISFGIIHLHNKYNRLLNLVESSAATNNKLNKAVYETVVAGVNAWRGVYAKNSCNRKVEGALGSSVYGSLALGSRGLGVRRLGSGLGYAGDDFLGYWELSCLAKYYFKLEVKLYKNNGSGEKALKLVRFYLL